MVDGIDEIFMVFFDSFVYRVFLATGRAGDRKPPQDWVCEDKAKESNGKGASFLWFSSKSFNLFSGLSSLVLV